MESEKDPREIEALRIEAEARLRELNTQRAQRLIDDRLVDTTDLAYVRDYLSAYDPRLLELIEDQTRAEFIRDEIGAFSPGEDEEFKAALSGFDDLVSDEEKFEDLSYGDPVLIRDAISRCRARALVFREYEGDNPVDYLSKFMAFYLALKCYASDLEVPESLSQHLSRDTLERLRATVDVWDSGLYDQELEQQHREALAEFGVDEDAFADSMAQAPEREERQKRMLQSVFSRYDDIQTLAEQILNAPKGKLPI